MQKNIHPYERALRVLVGAGLCVIAFTGPSNPWLLLGTIPLLTGLIGWCPPYAILGFSTCPKKRDF